MMNKRYLPIGSIVKLKGKNKSFMITGYYSVEYENALEIYDYSACAYPEGVMIKSSYCSFNQKDIESVLFEGFKTEEYTKLTNSLNELDSDITNNEMFFEEKKIELDEIDSSKEENDDFVFPHYKFDEKGIIIE